MMTTTTTDGRARRPNTQRCRPLGPWHRQACGRARGHAPPPRNTPRARGRARRGTFAPSARRGPAAPIACPGPGLPCTALRATARAPFACSPLQPKRASARESERARARARARATPARRRLPGGGRRRPPISLPPSPLSWLPNFIDTRCPERSRTHHERPPQCTRHGQGPATHTVFARGGPSDRGLCAAHARTSSGARWPALPFAEAAPLPHPPLTR